MKTTTTTSTTMRVLFFLIAGAAALEESCGDIDGDASVATVVFTCTAPATIKATPLTALCATSAVAGTCDAATCCDAAATTTTDGLYDTICAAADDAEACVKNFEKAVAAYTKAAEKVMKCATDNATDATKLATCMGSASYDSEKACNASVDAYVALDEEYAASTVGKAAKDACNLISSSLTGDALAAYTTAKAADSSPAAMISAAIALIALLL